MPPTYHAAIPASQSRFDWGAWVARLAAIAGAAVAGAAVAESFASQVSVEGAAAGSAVVFAAILAVARRFDRKR